MNTNKLTIKAQEALADMQSIAAERQHQEIQPEHLLLALLQQPDGVAQTAFNQIVYRGCSGVLTENPAEVRIGNPERGGFFGEIPFQLRVLLHGAYQLLQSRHHMAVHFRRGNTSRINALAAEIVGMIKERE